MDRPVEQDQWGGSSLIPGNSPLRSFTATSPMTLTWPKQHGVRLTYLRWNNDCVKCLLSVSQWTKHWQATRAMPNNTPQFWQATRSMPNNNPQIFVIILSVFWLVALFVVFLLCLWGWSMLSCVMSVVLHGVCCTLCVISGLCGTITAEQ